MKKGKNMAKCDFMEICPAAEPCCAEQGASATCVPFLLQAYKNLKGKSSEEKPEEMKVMYLCDRRACTRCDAGCKHTTNIRHAVNFQLAEGCAGLMEEKE